MTETERLFELAGLLLNCARYRKALERLAQAMPLVNPRDHLGAELHARIMFAREALKGDE